MRPEESPKWIDIIIVVALAIAFILVHVVVPGAVPVWG